MKTLIYILLLVCIFLPGCTIIQEYHFNKDFSGNTRLSIDMETFLQMMSGMDTTGSSNQNMKDSLDFVFSEGAAKLREAGVTNINHGWEPNSNILFMSYEFSDIEMLNKALNESNAQNASLSKSLGNQEHVYFLREGKSLYYRGPKSERDSIGKDMESMNEYYHYSLIFTFDHKIKKVDNPNVKLSSDKKKAEMSGSMFKIIRPDYNSDINFRLK